MWHKYLSKIDLATNRFWNEDTWAWICDINITSNSSGNFRTRASVYREQSFRGTRLVFDPRTRYLYPAWKEGTEVAQFLPTSARKRNEIKDPNETLLRCFANINDSRRKTTRIILIFRARCTQIVFLFIYRRIYMYIVSGCFRNRDGQTSRARSTIRMKKKS